MAVENPCPCDGRKCQMSADDDRHGSQNGYGNLFCRCGPCRKAHADYFRVGKASESLRRYRDRLTSEGRMRGYPNRKLKSAERA